MDFLIKRIVIKTLLPKYYQKETVKTNLQFRPKEFIKLQWVQAINGKSYISFPKNSRLHNMMLFVAEIRKCNLSNKDIIPYIDCVINDYSVNRENII